MTVPVWLTIPQFANSFAATLDLAKRADSLGLAGLFTFDHLIPIEDPQRPVLEGAATLGALAAVATVPAGSLVTRVTLRPPQVTAALATTMHDVSRTGAVLGLGVGDRLSEDEARRYGMQRLRLDDRIALLEDTIALVRQTSPDLTVWVAGRHEKLRAVAARVADGWNVWEMPLDEFQVTAGEMRAAHADGDLTISWGGRIVLGSDDESVEQEMFRRNRDDVFAGTPDLITEHLSRFARVADQLIVSVLPNRPDNWELFAAKVLARLA